MIERRKEDKMTQQDTTSKLAVARLDSAARFGSATIEQPQSESISLLRKTDKLKPSGGSARQSAQLPSEGGDVQQLPRANGNTSQTTERDLESETYSVVSSSPSQSASVCLIRDAIQGGEFSDDDETFEDDCDEDDGDDDECSIGSHFGAQVEGSSPASNQLQQKRASKPRRRVATMAQRRAANIRERRRMFNLNSAFDRLRKKVPSFAYEKRLSRIETLKLAIMYIKFMDDLVNDDAYVEKYKQLTANTSVAAASSGFLSPGAYLSLYGASAAAAASAAAQRQAASSPPLCSAAAQRTSGAAHKQQVGLISNGPTSKLAMDSAAVATASEQQDQNFEVRCSSSTFRLLDGRQFGNYRHAKQLPLSPACCSIASPSPSTRSTTSVTASAAAATNSPPPTSPSSQICSRSMLFSSQANSSTAPLSNLATYASYQTNMSPSQLEYDPIAMSQQSCCPNQHVGATTASRPRYYENTRLVEIERSKFIELSCQQNNNVSSHNQREERIQQQYFSAQSAAGQQILVRNAAQHYPTNSNQQGHRHTELGQHQVIYGNHQERSAQRTSGYSLQSLEAR